MSRQESDREDLLREATALAERIELALGGERVTAGFRSDGAASIFFNGDCVYQFNASGELRRAHCDGLLFKAVDSRLVSLRRARQPGEVQLLRHELSDAEQRAFLTRMTNRLGELSLELERANYAVVGQVPADASVLVRLREWLADFDGFKIARSPHVQPRSGK
jgi:hypothetical protein